MTQRELSFTVSGDKVRLTRDTVKRGDPEWAARAFGLTFATTYPDAVAICAACPHCKPLKVCGDPMYCAEGKHDVNTHPALRGKSTSQLLRYIANHACPLGKHPPKEPTP